MQILHALFRAYAYVYYFVLAAFLAGIALVAYLTGVHNINTGGMTTVTGETLSRMLLAIGVVGIATVLLALLGIVRWLFPLFAIAAVVTMFRWLFLSPYSFGSAESFRLAILLFLGAIVAMLCSFLEFKNRKNKRR